MPKPRRKEYQVSIAGRINKLNMLHFYFCFSRAVKNYPTEITQHVRATTKQVSKGSIMLLFWFGKLVGLFLPLLGSLVKLRLAIGFFSELAFARLQESLLDIYIYSSPARSEWKTHWAARGSGSFSSYRT
jgi:hypothetical protein